MDIKYFKKVCNTSSNIFRENQDHEVFLRQTILLDKLYFCEYFNLLTNLLPLMDSLCWSLFYRNQNNNWRMVTTEMVQLCTNPVVETLAEKQNNDFDFFEIWIIFCSLFRAYGLFLLKGLSKIDVSVCPLFWTELWRVRCQNVFFQFWNMWKLLHRKYQVVLQHKNALASNQRPQISRCIDMYAWMLKINEKLACSEGVKYL